jgi:protocatechuate 3,4-dioxygenase beta subunit
MNRTLLPWTRRAFATGIVGGSAIALTLPLLARAQQAGAGMNYPYPAVPGNLGLTLAPTPSCSTATEAQTEGPFYSPSTPLRTSLLEGTTRARKLVLEGLVLTPDCRPVANAVIDFWHCDDEGVYDTRAFRYRGHQFTDANGVYRLETIRPPQYAGRTPHIHAKLQGQRTRLLTTQIYFPDEVAANARDGIYRPSLTIAQRTAADGSVQGRFDFVLTAA